MVDEQQDTLPKAPDDGLDDDALTPKLPFFWFGLILIPVVMGLFASIFAPRAPEEGATAEQAQAVIEQPVRQIRDRRDYDRNGSSRRTRNQRSTPLILDKSCNFADYVGRPYSNTIKSELNLTKRQIRWLKEVGQKTPLTDIYRINVYLNPQKTITRIECG